MTTLYFTQQLINALALASVYALLALSFTLIYGIIGKINFAFGEMLMVGAMVTAIWSLFLAVYGVAGWPVVLSLVLAASLLTGAAHGWTTERLVFRRLRVTRGHAPLIAAIALSIIYQEGVRVLQGAGDFWLRPDFSLSFVLAEAGGFDVVANWKQIAIIAATLVSLIGLGWLLKSTRFGLHYRACADDVRTAALMGVDADKVIALTFTLGGGLAGLAGFVLIEYYGVANFFMGFLTGFKALTAAIVGGIGSIRGAVLGGALIALLETFWSGYLGGTYREVAVFGVLALVLVFRPSGLLGREPDVLYQEGR
jgi:branched-chain amino acid transport system permease protein